MAQTIPIAVTEFLILFAVLSISTARPIPLRRCEVSSSAQDPSFWKPNDILSQALGCEAPLLLLSESLPSDSSPEPAIFPSLPPLPPPVGSLPTMIRAQSGVGQFLGISRLETSSFRRECKKCCGLTRSRYHHLHAWRRLRYCHSCNINWRVSPPRSGKCTEVVPLGCEDTPSECFFETCHQVLVKEGDHAHACIDQ